MMNIVNGGSHANNLLDFQEFMIIPCKFETFRDSLRAGCEIFHALKELLISKNFSVSVGMKEVLLQIFNLIKNV